jgi:hypothetical protein
MKVFLSLVEVIYGLSNILADLGEEPQPKVGTSSKERARMNSPCSPSSAAACYGGWTNCRVSRRLGILADEADFK